MQRLMVTGIGHVWGKCGLLAMGRLGGGARLWRTGALPASSGRAVAASRADMMVAGEKDSTAKLPFLPRPTSCARVPLPLATLVPRPTMSSTVNTMGWSGAGVDAVGMAVGGGCRRYGGSGGGGHIATVGAKAGG